MTAAGRIDAGTLRRGVIHGSVVASFNVEGISVERLGTVSAEEVRLRYDGFAKLAHFATADELRRIS